MDVSVSVSLEPRHSRGEGHFEPKANNEFKKKKKNKHGPRRKRTASNDHEAQETRSMLGRPIANEGRDPRRRWNRILSKRPAAPREPERG
jgi:hypothetical protein